MTTTELPLSPLRDFHPSNIYTVSPQSTLDEILQKYDEERVFIKKENESEPEKLACLHQLLARAASNGDAQKIQDLIRDARHILDLDAQDEDGVTPLIYAACFGHIDVLYALITAGANVDAQDKNGWSALMWATNNNHDKIAKSLLDNGASVSSKSKSGRTVIQYIKHAFTHDGANNEKLLEVFSTPQENNGLGFSWTGDLTAGGYYKSNERTEENLIKELELARECTDSFDVDIDEIGLMEEDEDDDIPIEFCWETCLLGQMLVFGKEHIDRILQTVIVEQKPICSREQKFTPANVLFLAARYAHYFDSMDLLEQLLDLSVIKISEAVAYKKEVTFLAFWMSNCCQLLYYLKKDHGLVHATVEYQVRLSEIVSEIYERLVRDVQRRIESVLGTALLWNQAIPLGDVKFEKEARRSFFGRLPDSPASKASPLPSGRVMQRRTSGSFTVQRNSQSRRSLSQSVGPRSVTALLSSTLFILQTYSVHPSLIHYTLAQLLYFISAETFNQILTSKGLCSRSRAMQIRYNLAGIEEWVRANLLPKSLFHHIKTVVELLQFLQCMSQLQDLQAFEETVRQLSRLNPLQVRLAALMYRYEVIECKLPDVILQSIERAATDTRIKALQPTGYCDDDDATTHSQRSVVDLDRDAKGNLGETDMAELMDPDHLLPFSLPTVADMEVGVIECSPNVPDHVMEVLFGRPSIPT